ncbi:hypothetical protein [Streptomyces sp. NPDC003710]
MHGLTVMRSGMTGPASARRLSRDRLTAVHTLHTLDDARACAPNSPGARAGSPSSAVASSGPGLPLPAPVLRDEGQWCGFDDRGRRARSGGLLAVYGREGRTTAVLSVDRPRPFMGTRRELARAAGPVGPAAP